MTTEKMDRINALYKLEYLVMTGGDKEEIKELRKVLNAEKSQGPKPRYVFDKALYLKLKKKGKTDMEIAKEMNMSKDQIKRAKIENGLTVPRKKNSNMES